MLQPHHCDLHTVKQPKEDIQPELEEAKHTVETKVIKKECYNSMWIEVDKCDEFVLADEEFSIYNHCVKLESKLVDDALCKVKIEPVASSSTVEQVYENQCTLKYESTTFGCTVCFEEFNHEHEYNKHMSLHVQAAADNDSCVVSQARDSSIVVGSRLLLLDDSSHVTEHKYPVQQLCEDSHQSTNLAQTSIASLTPRLSTNKEIKVLPSGKVSSLKSTKKKSERISKLKIASTEYHFQAASESDVQVTENTGSIPDTAQIDSDCSINDFNAQFYNSAHYIRPRTHTEEKCFICDFCQKKFKRKSLLVKHIMSHTGEKPHSCELCSYKSTRKYDLVRHMQTHTGEQPYSCNVCKYKFVRNSDLVYHMRTHTGEKPYYCKLCEYKCVKNSNLVRHMRTHTGEKPYACMVCEYTCALKNSLVMHMRTHTGDKPYSCDLCDYKCAQNSNLVSHMRAHTSEKPFSCMLCEYKCALNSDLVKHVRTHTGEKPYSCELCEYKCALKYSLVLHMRTHTGVKPYSCKLCEYRSAHKNSVVLHMRTHTNKKPYSCELCEYKSAYKHSLVLHMRTHTGEKPFSCKLCDYKCAQNSNLVTHMRTHTGEKPDDS